MLARTSGSAWATVSHPQHTNPRLIRAATAKAASALDVQLCSTQQQLLGLGLDGSADAATVTSACMHSLWLHRQATPEGAAENVEQQLLDLLVSLVCKQAGTSSPKDVIEQAWALSQHPLQLPACQSLGHVLVDTTGQHLALQAVTHPTELLLLLQAAHSLSAAPDSSWWEGWQQAMVPHVPNLSGGALAQVMWWARFLDLAPSPHFLDMWLAATQVQLTRAAPATPTNSTSQSSGGPGTSRMAGPTRIDNQLPAQQVQRMLLGLADLGVAGPLPDPWGEAWAAAMQPRLPDVDLEQLSLCIWSAAVMQLQLSPSWAHAFGTALQHALGRPGPARLVALGRVTPPSPGPSLAQPAVVDGTDLVLRAGDSVIARGRVIGWVSLPHSQPPPASGTPAMAAALTYNKGASGYGQILEPTMQAHAAAQGCRYLAQVELQGADCNEEHAPAYRRLMVAYLSLGWVSE